MQKIFSKTYFKFGIVFFPLFLLFSTMVPVSSLAEGAQLGTEIGKYKDYVIKFVQGEAPSGSLNELFITRQNQTLFTEEGVIGIRNGDNLKLIEDLNNITSPILIIDDYSGGAHCCYSTTILSLQPDFKILAIFEGGHSAVSLKKLQNTDGFAIELDDWVSAYKWTSFAGSYAPKVLLHLVQDKVSVALEEMKNKPLTPGELTQIVEDINSNDYNNFKYPSTSEAAGLTEETRQENEEYFSKLLKPVLDLIYSGNTQQAQQVIERTWPGDKASKEYFINEMKQTLRTSRYYKDIAKLNEPHSILGGK